MPATVVASDVDTRPRSPRGGPLSLRLASSIAEMDGSGACAVLEDNVEEM